MDRVEIESKRVSTSSQTNYLDGDKVLYAREGYRTYAKVRENGIRHLRDSFGGFYIKKKKDYSNPIRKQGKYNQGALEGKYLATGVGKSWISEVFENFPKVNERKTKGLWSWADKKRQVRKKDFGNINKHRIPSKSQEEALFEEFPKKSRKNPINDFSMHKTFYDIFPDIKQVH